MIETCKFFSKVFFLFHFNLFDSLFVRSLFLLDKNPFFTCFNKKLEMFQKQRPKLRKLQVEHDFDDDKNPNATFYGDTTYKFEDVMLE